jgi:hypothetical protein
MADRRAISTRRAYRLVVMITLLLAGCATVKVTGQRALGTVPTAAPQVIYVADFTFKPAGIRAERGVLPISLVNEAASESSIVFSRIFGVQINRGVRERELVNLMTTSLIEDLRNVGVTAYRFGPRDQLPAGSWLLQGTFVQVDEGNRLERALIGFGQGATELDVVASLSDLRGDHPRPFCEVSTIAHSRRQAGAIMSLTPSVRSGASCAAVWTWTKTLWKLAPSWRPPSLIASNPAIAHWIPDSARSRLRSVLAPTSHQH